MRAGQTSTALTSAKYGFASGSDCMPAPHGWQPGTALTAVLRLLRVIPANDAKPIPTHLDVVKITCKRGSSWQTPRPPYEVTFECALTRVEADYEAAASAAAWTTHTLALGDGALPDKVHAAVQSMPEGESAVFRVPREQVDPAQAHLPDGFASMPTGVRERCLLHVHMKSFVEVRDMTGDGQVLL